MKPLSYPSVIVIFLLLAVSVFRHQAAETLTDSRLTYPSESVSPRIIFSPEITPDELYGDSIVVVSHEQETTNTTPAAFMLDHTHDFHWEQFAVPAGVIAASSLFVRTPKLVQAREWVQKQLANRTGQPRTEVDNYLQYLPLAAGYGLYACGVKGEHNLLDKTIILAMSYATFAAVNHSLKFAFGEQRPNSMAMNSFPSGHTGTAFAGAEFLRREYWDTNKWIGVAGYACAAVVGYMRTAFAYWLYPRIFRRRAQLHSQELLQRLSLSPEYASSSSAASPQPVCVASPWLSGSSAGVSCMVLF